MNTKALLAEIDASDAIAAKATPGPWIKRVWVDEFCNGREMSMWYLEPNGDWEADGGAESGIECDADFIAHAREALPARNAQLREALAEIERLEAECNSMKCDWSNGG